jgi:hypothetical protein
MINKVAFSKETVECLHLILWPGSKRKVHCHTAKLETNRRVTIDRVSLLDEHHAMQTYEGVDVQLHAFLTSARS